MFTTSTQRKHWLFKSTEDLTELREKCNVEFVGKYSDVDQSSEELEHFLSSTEELQLCLLVAETALKFCKAFHPPMPPAVVWTGFNYFKRFFLKHSVMEHFPKHTIMACFYLACKVEEFNITATDFVRNLKSGTPEGNTETILTLEPIIMEKLAYQLTVHSPFRALEGHLIEIKTRLQDHPDPERYRDGCRDFLERALLTDTPLLFPPTQIALAALVRAARDMGDDLRPLKAPEQTALQTRAKLCMEAMARLQEAKKQKEKPKNAKNEDTDNANGETNGDDDDD